MNILDILPVPARTRIVRISNPPYRIFLESGTALCYNRCVRAAEVLKWSKRRHSKCFRPVPGARVRIPPSALKSLYAAQQHTDFFHRFRYSDATGNSKYVSGNGSFPRVKCHHSHSIGRNPFRFITLCRSIRFSYCSSVIPL